MRDIVSLLSGKDVDASYGIGAYEWRPAEDSLFWSAGLKAIYGVEAAPTCEQGFQAYVHPDDRMRVEAETLAWLSSDATQYDHTFRIIRPDGEVRRVVDRGVIERDADGRVVAMRGLNIDITSEVAGQDERYELVHKATRIGLWDADLVSGRSFWNAELYDLLGLDGGEAASPDLFFRHVLEEDLEGLKQAYQQAIERQDDFTHEFRMRRNNGDIIWVAAIGRVTEMRDGRPVRMSGVNFDITPRKQAELALENANAAFRRLVENSPFGIYFVDADFNLSFVSIGAKPVFQNVDPLIGRDFAEVLRTIWEEPHASEFIDIFRRTLETGAPYHSAGTTGARADLNEIGAFDWRTERIVGPDGRYGVVCQFYDLTEQRRQRAQIEYLMREISHRSRNLLTLVGAMARQIEAADTDELVERLTDRIMSLARAQDVVSMRTTADGADGADLAELVRAQLAHFGDLAEGRVSLEGPDLFVSAHAAQHLAMAFHELATNAVKHGALSSGDGRVRIVWSINKEARPATFDMEWRESDGPPVVEPASRGFGSRIVREAVPRMFNGDAALEFRRDGLRWRVTCPLDAVQAQERMTDDAPPRNAAGSSRENRAILVVEDDAVVAWDVCRILSRAGFEIVGPAASVGEAMSLLDRSAPAFAVLDIRLGAETAAPVAAKLNEIGVPFLCLSGLSPMEQTEIFRRAAFVSKPLSPQSLLVEIERHNVLR